MIAELQEFSQIVQGGRHKKTGKHFVETGGYPAFGAGGLNGYLPIFEFERPGIVLSAIGARCGKCFLPQDNRWSSLANTQIIFPDCEKADIRFIWYQLNDELSWIRRGTAQPYIRPADVKRRKVYLPPLPEQRRLTAILDKADGIRRKCEQALEMVDNAIESSFLNFFGDPAHNPNGWPERTMSELGVVKGGLQVSRKRDELLLRKPYLRVANVFRDRLELLEVKEIGLTSVEFQRVQLQEGDVLIVEGHGNPDEIGRAAVWDGSIADCVHQNHLIRFRANRSVVLPEYISRLLNSQGGRRQLIAASRTTSGLNTISTKKVKEVVVPSPPIELQKHFVVLLRRFRRLFHQLESKRVDAISLFRSLSQRALRGEL